MGELGDFGGEQGVVGARGEELGPVFPFDEGFDQAGAAVAGGAAAFVEGVVGGVLRMSDEVAGEGDGFLGLPEFVVGADEPLFVVGVVVNLVGLDEILDHVSVINASGGFLLPGSVVEAAKLGVDVAGHVPHVGDAGSGRAASGGGFEALFRLETIPKMDGVVMGGVIGVDGEDLIQDGLNGHGTADGGFVFAVPNLPSEEGFGLDVVGVGLHDEFHVADAIELPFVVVPLVLFEVTLKHIDPEQLMRMGFGFSINGLSNEAAGAFLVVEVGHGHAPVGHGAVGIEFGDLPKGAFGFEEPETMELADALIEEALGERFGSGHREVDLPCAGHDVRLLAGAFVECLPMRGMARQRIRCLQAADGQGRKEEQACGHDCVRGQLRLRVTGGGGAVGL